jgi:hypothetical protein
MTLLMGFCLTNSPAETAVGDLEFHSASHASVILQSKHFAFGDRKTVFIRSLGDPRVSLKGPIPVAVETLDGEVTVYSADTGDFVVGADEPSAIDEFRASMVELYFMLKSEKHSLGPLPQKHWHFLSSVIDEG